MSNGDFQPDQHWAHQRLLLKVRCGSQAHGLATPESDEDTRGICVPIEDVFFGLRSFEQWQSEGGDHVIFSLQKFIRLALEGNPNIIETLFTAPQDHIFVHPLATELLEKKSLFLSRQVGTKFGRYALHQLQKIERHYRWLNQPAPDKPEPKNFGAVMGKNGPRFPDTHSEKSFRAAIKHHRNYREWRKNRNPKRALLEERYGYDTKHAMHLCRLLMMGTEILTEGEVRVRRPDADWLRGVRKGKLAYPELLKWAKSAERELEEAERNSLLPEKPDAAFAEKLCIQITREFLRLTPS